MYIILKEESNLPIYEQIVNAVKEGLINHTIQPGEMLPSIRSLAKDLQISVITTKRAYDELEKDGLIYSVPGKGFYVKETNQEFLREQQLKKLEQQLSDWIEQARGLGISPDEMKSMLDVLCEGRKES
ncbi:MAG: GntR family transcriptional regulator [Eubacteriales bacterium]|nr:GntR family transcriptional regulator [Eubacteriales bacterium]